MNKTLKIALLISLAGMISVSCEEAEDGLDGKDGANGKDAAGLLISTAPESIGANCESGGTKIDVGADKNSNDVLDSDEIQKTFFVCNGQGGSDAAKLLVETVNESIGENCASGGIKLRIGHDLNRNDELDDNEVSKISYICNGDDATYEGKTYVILSGDITDLEAQAKLDAEVGMNTQFVWIVGTTSLSNVDLSHIEELAELRIEGNEALKKVDLKNLKHVFGEVEVNQNSIDSLKVNSLETVLGDIVISNNRGLAMLDLKNLKSADYLAIETNVDLAAVVFGPLQSCELMMVGNAIKSLDLSMLTAGQNISLNLFEAALIDVNLANLTSIERLSIENSAISDLDLSSLTAAGSLNFQGNFENIDVSNLVMATELVTISQCESLVNLSISRLQSTGGVLIGGCHLLGQINMPNLTQVDELQLSNLQSIVTLNLAGLKSVKKYLHISSTTLQEVDLRLLESARFVEIIFNSKMTALHMPRLFESGIIKISENSLLTHLDLTNLSSVNFENEIGREVHLNNNSFSSDSINSILNILATLSPPLTDARILLGQIPPAPATGQGLTDKAILESNGNTVETDL